MPITKIKARAPKAAYDSTEVDEASGEYVKVVPEASFEFDFGDTAAEAIESFGDDQVLDSFVAGQTVACQNIIRRHLEAGCTAEEVSEKMTAWVPGYTLERIVDPVAKAKNIFLNMDADERAQLMAELQAQANA